MVLHYLLLIVIVISSVIWERGITERKHYYGDEYRTTIIPWLPAFAFLTFLAGMRTDVNDSLVYINSFEELNPSWGKIYSTIADGGKELCFKITMNLAKMYISDNYHVWFFIFAIIESIIIILVLRRESYSLFVSLYFFWASTLYYNFFSMMRQWFAVIIVFYGFKYIQRRQFIQYLLLCLVAAQFHSSAYFMIPVYFLLAGRSFGLRQTITIVLFTIGIMYLEPLLSGVGEISEGTTYDYVINTMQTSSGSSVIRIFIAATPVFLAFIYRFNICSDKINICVNAAIINLLVNILAAFTSGLYVIRMSVYFNVFNMLLYPYLFERMMPKQDRRVWKMLFVILYFVFHYMQMTIMSGFYYGSDIIGYYY